MVSDSGLSGACYFSWAPCGGTRTIGIWDTFGGYCVHLHDANWSPHTFSSPNPLFLSANFSGTRGPLATCCLSEFWSLSKWRQLNVWSRREWLESIYIQRREQRVVVINETFVMLFHQFMPHSALVNVVDYVGIGRPSFPMRGLLCEARAREH